MGKEKRKENVIEGTVQVRAISSRSEETIDMEHEESRRSMLPLSNSFDLL